MDTHATERISDLHAAEAPAAGAQASGNDKRKLYIKKLGTSDITLTEQIAKAEKSNFSRPLTADALAQMLSSSPYGITALLSGDGQVLSYAVYLVSLDEAANTVGLLCCQEPRLRIQTFKRADTAAESLGYLQHIPGSAAVQRSGSGAVRKAGLCH